MIPLVKIQRKYLVFIAIFIISLSFALYTKHTWEDWYITYRCSKNFALGNGLVYTVGQKIHAFTSPIGTLIPALLNIITFHSSDELVLWIFRIIGCCLLGLSAVLLFSIAKQSSLRWLPTIFLLSMFGVNVNIIDFSINGMETAFMIFFLTWYIYSMTIPSRYPSLNLGLAWAGLMWTRPDSFIYIGGLSLGYLLFSPTLSSANSRNGLAKVYIKAGVILVLLYLPWILWAWFYYGSPVPHTVVAKSLLTLKTPINIPHLIKQILATDLKSLFSTFMPPYYFFSGWGDSIASNYSKPLAFISAFYWIFPFARPEGRAISFATMVAHLYLTYVADIIPWYIPPVTLLSIFVLSQIMQQAMTLEFLLSDRINNKILKGVRTTIYTISCVVILTNLFLTLAASYQLRLQQEIIENGNRKQIGLWLKENAATSKDSVFLETLGYIGFFSQLKMYDWPGLSSPEVIAARKRMKSDKSFAELIGELQPDWVVLRPIETKRVEDEAPTLLTERYQAVKVFDVSKRIQSYPFIPGRGYLRGDQTFTVFRKRK
jgi:hypothetical protein